MIDLISGSDITKKCIVNISVYETMSFDQLPSHDCSNKTTTAVDSNETKPYTMKREGKK